MQVVKAGRAKGPEGLQTSSKVVRRKGLAALGRATGRRSNQTKVKPVEVRAVRRTDRAKVKLVEDGAIWRPGRTKERLVED